MGSRIRGKLGRYLRENYLLVLTLLGIIVGLGVALGIRPYKPSADLVMWLSFPGEMFMRAIQMVIIPFLIANIIAVTANIDMESQGKISGCTILYIICANTIASITAVIIHIIIKPGAHANNSNDGVKNETTPVGMQDMFADLLRNIVPDNLIEACMYTAVTDYEENKFTVLDPSDNGTTTTMTMKRILKLSRGTNILGVVVCSIVFGMIAGQHGKQARPFVEFFEALQLITTTILKRIMWTLPLGVCSLTLSSILKVDNLESVVESLGLFVGAVTIAVFFQQLVTIQIVYFIFVRRNPFRFYVRLGKAWITAFTTTLSLVALPSLFEACDEWKVDSRVSRSVISISINWNADGSSAYICAATLFIAEISGHSLSAASTVAIVFLVPINVMALPAIPSASIITVVLLLNSVNVPVAPVSLLFTTEFLLDRIRTTTNCVGNAYCAAVIDALCRSSLKDVQDNHMDEYEVQPLNS